MRIVFMIGLFWMLPLQAERDLFVIRIGDQYGYIDRGGKVVIPPQFQQAGDFADGFAKVISPLSGRKVFINAKGESVIHLPDGTTAFSSFSEGLLMVKFDNGLYGFLNRSGQVAFEHSYQDARSFSEGLGAVKIDGKWGFINRKGEIVVENRFERVGEFSEGLSSVKWRQGLGFIDKTGRVVISGEIKDPRLQQSPDLFFRFSGGLARIRVGKRMAFIDRNGRLAMGPFEDALDFSEGMAAVRRGEKWGYVGRKGEVLVDFQFDDAASFSQGLAAVNKEHGIGFINQKGELAIPLRPYSYDAYLPDDYSFSNGLASVCLAGATLRDEDRQCVYIDREENIVWPNGLGQRRRHPLLGFPEQSALLFFLDLRELSKTEKGHALAEHVVRFFEHDITLHFFHESDEVFEEFKARVGIEPLGDISRMLFSAELHEFGPQVLWILEGRFNRPHLVSYLSRIGTDLAFPWEKNLRSSVYSLPNGFNVAFLGEELLFVGDRESVIAAMQGHWTPLGDKSAPIEPALKEHIPYPRQFWIAVSLAFLESSEMPYRQAFTSVHAGQTWRFEIRRRLKPAQKTESEMDVLRQWLLDSETTDITIEAVDDVTVVARGEIQALTEYGLIMEWVYFVMHARGW